MKKTILLLLCACLLLPAYALGDRLMLTVSSRFVCDAQTPSDVPQSLPMLMAEPVAIDVESAIQLLMPGKGPWEEWEGGGVTVGNGDGEHDYMLIEKDYGRVCFSSEYVNLYLLELMPERGRVTKRYLPTDLELDFMTSGEAVQTAAELMGKLGIEVATDSAVVYTLEPKSFAVMQDAMRESEWLATTSRKRALRYLEPLAAEHEGYCVNLTSTIAGYPYVVFDNRWEVSVFITLQGIEYVETGFSLRIAGTGEEKPLVSIEEALKSASEGRLNMETGALCTIEGITLSYRFDTEKEMLTPCWVFDYCTDGAGGMQDYTFDHSVNLYGVGVDAHSGKVLEQTIF